MKLKGKLISAYIILFCVFSITIFAVADSQVRSLAGNNEMQQLNIAAETGISFLNQSFRGEFNIVNGKLYKSDIPLELIQLL
jgi:methyl-accepting chemotaxis protein